MEEAPPKENRTDLSDLFSSLFEQSSGTGDEELLRLATTYSRQLTGYQMKGLLLLEMIAKTRKEKEKEMLEDFVFRYLELKQYNNSALFIMKALDSISVKRFLGENSIKVAIEK
jgi:hypothetical protein